MMPGTEEYISGSGAMAIAESLTDTLKAHVAAGARMARLPTDAFASHATSFQLLEVPPVLQPLVDLPAAVFTFGCDSAESVSQVLQVALGWVYESVVSMDYRIVEYLVLHVAIFIAFYIFASPLRAKQKDRESWYDFAFLFGCGCMLAMWMYHWQEMAGLNFHFVDMMHFYYPVVAILCPVLFLVDLLILRLPPLRRTLRKSARSFIVNMNSIAFCMCVQYGFCRSHRAKTGGLAEKLFGYSSWVSFHYNNLGEGSEYCSMLEDPHRLPLAIFLTVILLCLWSFLFRITVGRGFLVVDSTRTDRFGNLLVEDTSLDSEQQMLRRLEKKRDTESARLLQQRPTMCSWYSHHVFSVGAEMVLQLKVFLGRFDVRVLRATMETQARKEEKDRINRSFADRDELWFDFVADTGDGFNPTYAIARSLAQMHLRARLPKTAQQTAQLQSPERRRRSVSDDDRHMSLPRGDLLLHGGDLAYPQPSMQVYEERLIRPWEAALPPPPDADTEEVCPDMIEESEKVAKAYGSPTCWMIPGNHDWFDGLEAFLHSICGRQWIGGWHLPQTSSYWALELPHDWFVFGMDLALTDDLDEVQYSYFRKIVTDLPRDASVIAITHQPYWLNDQYYLRKPSHLYNRLLALLGPRLRLKLAGDIHNYMRHSPKGPHAGPECIISGGGGAFLHPTHLNIEIPGYQESAVFPSHIRSKAFAMQNPVLFRSRNLSVEMMMGILCVTMVFGALPLCGHAETALSSLRNGVGWANVFANLIFQAYSQILEHTVLSLLAHFVLLASCVGFVEAQWGRRRSLCYAIPLFLAYNVATVAVACFLETLVVRLSDEGHMANRGLGAEPPVVIQNLQEPWAEVGTYMFHGLQSFFDVPTRIHGARQAICAAPELATRWSRLTYLLLVPFFWVLATPITSFIVGCYLTISSLCGRHLDEAFSSLRIQDYKNFLRMHIDADGGLTVYALGIKRVPRDWEEDKGTMSMGDHADIRGENFSKFTPSKWKPTKHMPIHIVDQCHLPARQQCLLSRSMTQ